MVLSRALPGAAGERSVGRFVRPTPGGIVPWGRGAPAGPARYPWGMRVIAGTARGRPLIAPRGERTRPTSDLVRGALFNMLEHLNPTWGRVLDLFAGSGALGIEALSRGAGWVDFVEEDERAVAAIRQNLAATGFTERAAVHRVRVERFLTRAAAAHSRSAADPQSSLRKSYDIILADPPYAYPELSRLLAVIAEAGWLAPGGLLAIEHSRRVTLIPPPAFALVKEKHHGDTRLSIFRQEGSA